MAKDTSINVRLSAGERHRLEALARHAGLTPSETLRQVLRMVDRVEPVFVEFGKHNGAAVSQGHGAAA